MTRAEAAAVARLVIPSPLYATPTLTVKRTGPRAERRQVFTFRKLAAPDPITGSGLKLIVGKGADWLTALQDVAAKLAADDRR